MTNQQHTVAVPGTPACVRGILTVVFPSHRIRQQKLKQKPRNDQRTQQAASLSQKKRKKNSHIFVILSGNDRHHSFALVFAFVKKDLFELRQR